MSGLIEKCGKFANSALQAWLDDQSFVSESCSSSEFVTECPFSDLDLASPMPSFDKALCSKSDKNTDNDDRDLAAKTSPTVKRLPQASVHQSPPERRR